MNTLVLYHAGCADGLCAAWVHSRYSGPAEYKPVQYNEDPPDVRGRDVIILDFSYKREVMIDLYRAADSLLCLDHHKSAFEELAGLTFCVFDLNKSGARLAWDHFGPAAEDPPWLVDYVEDRDLWRWALPNSKAVSEAIALYGLSKPGPLSSWQVQWNEMFRKGLDHMASVGVVLLKHKGNHVSAATQANRLGFFKLDDRIIPVVNTTTAVSEIVGTMARQDPGGLAAGFFIFPDGRVQYSLRSTLESGVDCSKIAAAYGGGGHPNAAGFTRPQLFVQNPDPAAIEEAFRGVADSAPERGT